MPHAFSTHQFVFRLLFLLVDAGINFYILLTYQTLTLGTSHLDYRQLIVVFNVVMLMIIYTVDFIIVAVRRLRTNYLIGQGLTDLHKHEGFP